MICTYARILPVLSEKCDVNSQVVVVPDSTAAKKIPKIAGLLEYRKDQKKLYVRSNETWNSLPQEKEVMLSVI